jgi:chloride channel protein, CIC family
MRPSTTIPAYKISPEVYLWTLVASPIIGLWSVGFVRAIAWADRVRPSDWRRFVAPPLVFFGVGLLTIDFPELLGNGQALAQLLFLHRLAPLALALLLPLRQLATVTSAASGAPGGLFTPSLAAGALAGAALGELCLWFIRGVKSACSRFLARAPCSRRPRGVRSPRSC